MRTDQQVVDETIELARKFYLILGYESEPGFKFYESKHPMELNVWEMACIAQEMLTDTPVEDCLDNLDEELEIEFSHDGPLYITPGTIEIYD